MTYPASKAYSYIQDVWSAPLDAPARFRNNPIINTVAAPEKTSAVLPSSQAISFLSPQVSLGNLFSALGANGGTLLKSGVFHISARVESDNSQGDTEGLLVQLVNNTLSQVLSIGTSRNTLPLSSDPNEVNNVSLIWTGLISAGDEISLRLGSNTVNEEIDVAAYFLDIIER